MATQAYRHLLRATRIAFAGDERVLSAARDQIRIGFRDKASLAPSDPAVAPALQHAQQVAEFLRSNLVQGRKEAEDTYKLRIHEYTERGDNDTIKIAGKTVTVGSDGGAGGGGGCCSA